jgi:voltage-gated potassium channel
MIDSSPRRKASTQPISSAERSALRRAGASLVLTGVILLAGTAGYFILDDGRHDLLDCLFMTFITISTIGYEETIPLTTASSKIFTMILGVAGVANLAFFTSSTFAWIVEIETNPARRRLSMENRIEKLSGHYIVCGMGRAGTRISEELRAKGVSFVAIDMEDAKIDEHSMHVKGDASDDDVLMAANIGKCAGVFAVTGDDAKNLMITLAARDLAPKSRIVARASDERNAKRMTKSGANATICPDIAAGLKLASAMLTPHAHGFIDELSIGGNASLVEASIDEVDAGQTLQKFIAARHDLAAVALYRNEAWSVNPKPDIILARDDVLIMLSTPSK